jgi:hypothetical protein
LDFHHQTGFAPEVVNPVKISAFRGENVHKDVANIHKYPSGTGPAFGMVNMHSQVFKSALNFIGDGVNLATALTVTDYEIVGERANIFYIQQDYLRSLFIGSGFDYLARDINRFQSLLLSKPNYS